MRRSRQFLQLITTPVSKAPATFRKLSPADYIYFHNTVEIIYSCDTFCCKI